MLRHSADMQSSLGRISSDWLRCLTEARVCAGEEYLSSPVAYYKQHDVSAYIELACVDGWHDLIALHFPELLERIMVAIEGVRYWKSLSAFRGIECSECINVVFHCYGGQNRSAAVACFRGLRVCALWGWGNILW